MFGPHLAVLRADSWLRTLRDHSAQLYEQFRVPDPAGQHNTRQTPSPLHSLSRSQYATSKKQEVHITTGAGHYFLDISGRQVRTTVPFSFLNDSVWKMILLDGIRSIEAGKTGDIGGGNVHW